MGQIVPVIGPVGSGKRTLLKAWLRANTLPSSEIDCSDPEAVGNLEKRLFSYAYLRSEELGLTPSAGQLNVGIYDLHRLSRQSCRVLLFIVAQTTGVNYFITSARPLYHILGWLAYRAADFTRPVVLKDWDECSIGRLLTLWGPPWKSLGLAYAREDEEAKLTVSVLLAKSSGNRGQLEALRRAFDLAQAAQAPLGSQTQFPHAKVRKLAKFLSPELSAGKIERVNSRIIKTDYLPPTEDFEEC
jgi:hypothetical protein